MFMRLDEKNETLYFGMLHYHNLYLAFIGKRKLLLYICTQWCDHAVKLVMWSPHSLPPRQRGTFLLTSTIIFLARSHIALKWLALGPKLNHPCSSMGYLC